MIRDTTAAAASVQWRALIAMTGEQRLLQALELTDLVLKIQAEGREARGGIDRRASSAASSPTHGSS